METNETAQIPEFKLAKVGENRRRKGAGIAWFGGSNAARSAAGIGSSAAGSLSGLALKIMITLLVGGLGVGAYNYGKALRPDDSKFEAKKKASGFASKNEKPKYEGDLSKLPGSGSASPDSLTMVSGSKDGMTDAERAAKAKADADAAKAASDAQAKADAEKAKEPANVPAAGPDPAALAAASAEKEKEKAAAFAQKFGALSQKSGLAGGGGLSSGIGQNFASMSLAKQKANSGPLLAMASTRQGPSGSAVHAISGRNSGGGLAQRQLNNAMRQSAKAMTGANENRSSYAGAAFDNNPGAGQSIDGTGGSSGGAGPKSSPADSTGSGSGGGGSPATGIGGNTSSGPDDCGTLAAQYGWQGNFVNSTDGGCVLNQANVQGTGAADQTNQLFNFLKVLSMLATVISILLVVFSLLAKHGWPPALHMQVMCAKALVGVGALMTMLGLAVAGMGRTVEGTIFTAFGALTTVGGYMAMVAGEKAAKAQTAAEESAKKMGMSLADFMKGGCYVDQTADAAKNALSAALPTSVLTGEAAGGASAGINAAGTATAWH